MRWLMLLLFLVNAISAFTIVSSSGPRTSLSSTNSRRKSATRAYARMWRDSCAGVVSVLMPTAGDPVCEYSTSAGVPGEERDSVSWAHAKRASSGFRPRVCPR